MRKRIKCSEFFRVHTKWTQNPKIVKMEQIDAKIKIIQIVKIVDIYICNIFTIE